MKTINTEKYIENFCIIKEKNILFTGDDEGQLKEWKIIDNGKNLEFINNYQIHSKWIKNTIRLNDDKIITCSNDKLIKIYKLKILN